MQTTQINLLQDMPAVRHIMASLSLSPQIPQHRSQTNEHYTPENPYIFAVREVFDNLITLDPASCEQANHRIRAVVFYTQHDDGLQQRWFGNVFCNPPYGKQGNKSQAGLFCKKAINEYERGNIEQAILLINSNTGDGWFQPLFDYPICCVNHRIQFIDQFGQVGDSPTHSNVFVYLGPYQRRFQQLFEHKYKIGRVMEFARH